MILDLYESVKNEWSNNNNKFFGLPLKPSDFNINYQDMLDEYCEKYWNNDNPEFVPVIRQYLEGERIDILNKMIKFDPENPDISGYRLNEFNDYIVLSVFCYVLGKIKQINIMFLPIPTENIEWKMYNSYYTPRGTAKRNNKWMTKIDNFVNLPGVFRYNCENKEFKVFKKDYVKGDPLSNYVDEKSKLFLDAFTDGEFEIGEDNETFEKHLNQLPDSDYRNVLNYIYTDYNYFFRKIENILSKSFIDPTKNKTLNVVNCICKLGRKRTGDVGTIRENTPDCTLILNIEHSIIFSLTNIRSVLFYSDSYSMSFYFKNTELFFDAFKTPTSKAAGKTRNLLDDVFIKDGLMYKKYTLEDGSEYAYNQYEMYKMFFIDGLETFYVDEDHRIN